MGLLGAVAYREASEGGAAPSVVLATAHPAKLPGVVEAAVGVRPEIPPVIARALDAQERIVQMGGDLAELMELLDEVAGRPGSGPVTSPHRQQAAAVRVPGSTSNLGGGFDCVGLAVDRFPRRCIRARRYEADRRTAG